MQNNKYNKMKKILYEGKFKNIEEIEDDHIHLKNGTVIRKNEIIILPFGINISVYSENKTIKRIINNITKMKKILKIIRGKFMQTTTNLNLDKKYRRQGWNKDKDIKLRSIKEFDKDISDGIELSKKTIKPKKDKLYKFKIEFCFDKFYDKNIQQKYGDITIEYIKIYDKQYNEVILEAQDKHTAKKLFDKWNDNRKKELKVKVNNIEYYIKDNIEELIDKKMKYRYWGWTYHHPEYFCKVINIIKVKEK
jgi:hypothetical protein